MATLQELRNVRLEKLKKLQELGVNPYPARTAKTLNNAEVIKDFEKLETTVVSVAGRISSMRSHGKISFFDLKDASGVVQLYLKAENLSSSDYSQGRLSYDELYLFDMGDFVEVSGKVVKTKAGEISVEADYIRLLTKALRPLPDKHDGLQDREIRMRRRYLDTNVNDDVYQRFIRRAKFWEAHRQFFKQRGFYEINIPVLEQIPGGADANPFVTHMDSIDQDFFLRISHELYLKRLIGGGYEKVYEIGPRFRNEGLSDEHLPEHMAMEFYWAYASWEEGMTFIQDLFNCVLDYVYEGKKKFHIRGFDIEFKDKWEVIDFKDIMLKRFGIDIYAATLEEVQKAGRKAGLDEESVANVHRGVDNLWKILRKEIAGPAFLINHPKYISPLAKSKAENPNITERFQPIIAGSELGNGWSELNDPIDQLERFQEQQNLREAGDDEAQWLDIDYVEMLEYGMPPTFGYGHSERVFWFLEDVTAREGVPFPQLKHHIDDTTKEIYGLEDISLTGATAKSSGESISASVDGLPTREQAHDLLEKYVGDEYQKLHAKMVAAAMEAYAKELGEDADLWYVTGLLHDLDYHLHPDEHPSKSLVWFKDWGYPEQLIHAVAAHAHDRLGTAPATRLASALCAVDEMSGFLYAYSLMRPEGFEGMQASSIKKKFKDKSFAAKISREDIEYGLGKFEKDFTEHVQLLINVFNGMSELKK